MNRKLGLALTLLSMQALFLVPANVAPVHASDPTFQLCDVFAAVGSAKIAWWRPNVCGIPSSMTFMGFLTAPIGNSFMTGMAFNKPSCDLGPGNPCLYATMFDSQAVAIFDKTGAFMGTCGSGYSADPESIVIDLLSTPKEILVGQPDGTRVILHFNLDCSTGVPASYSPATQNRGTDWIDLAANLCTIRYTSEGNLIKSFDKCATTQLPDFATLPTSPAYALRIRTDASVLVADTSSDVHVNSGGTVINTCDSASAGAGGLFSLNVLPGGNEFVSGSFTNQQVDYMTVANCDTGKTTPDFSFNAVAGTGCTGTCTLFGLTVFGEVTVTAPPPAQIRVAKFFTDSSLNPLPLDAFGNPKVDVVLAASTVRSTNPGQVLAWVNVTNTGSVPLQSLKLNETLPVDWTINPPWLPGKGAIHVFYANTTSLATNPEITQPSTITVSTGNPEVVRLAIPSFNATDIGHPLLGNQTILLSVKLSYGLKLTTQSPSSYPRNYTDTANGAAWQMASFMGTEASATGSGFFIAYAKAVAADPPPVFRDPITTAPETVFYRNS